MLTFLSVIINELSPLVMPVIMISIAVVVGAVLVMIILKTIKLQRKLYNSITLVELKTTRIHYYIFSLVSAFMIILTVFTMIDVEATNLKFLTETFNMQRWQMNLMLGFLLIVLVATLTIFILLSMCKSAVVDRGIYINNSFIDWYHVHDYVIDESRGVVILTSSKDAFKTLHGTTPTLKVSKNDISKLKFILNKNKNKFSMFSSEKYISE